MAFKPKEPKIYSSRQLLEMSRDDLNIIAVSVNHMPAEDATNEDLVNQILVAQDVVMVRWQQERKEKLAAKEMEKEAFYKDKKIKGKLVPPEMDEDVAGPECNDPAEEVDERVWFKLAAGEGKLGKAPLFASLNGESILVQRGKWVKLKKKYLNVLRHAIVTEVEQDKDGEKNLRDVPRFNYQTRSLEEGQPVDTQAQSRSSF